MEITTEMVKELRQVTGAGVLEAKKTLEASAGDFDKAVQILREKGADRAAKRADRDANEGIIEVYSHPGNRVGVLLELNCETDFVARNEQFTDLAHNLVLQIAAMSPKYISIENVSDEDMETELSVLRAQAQAEGKPENIVEKIVIGRMNKYYEEVCLLEQPYIRDESFKIKDLISEAVRTTGENIQVRRFERYELGEAL
ncbi:MAG: translation elongation factor Ts [Candidatus Promineifilaceae bacterium]|jgi:elongation factor Ts